MNESIGYTNPLPDLHISPRHDVCIDHETAHGDQHFGTVSRARTWIDRDVSLVDHDSGKCDATRNWRKHRLSDRLRKINRPTPRAKLARRFDIRKCHRRLNGSEQTLNRQK